MQKSFKIFVMLTFVGAVLVAGYFFFGGREVFHTVLKEDDTLVTRQGETLEHESVASRGESTADMMQEVGGIVLPIKPAATDSTAGKETRTVVPPGEEPVEATAPIAVAEESAPASASPSETPQFSSYTDFKAGADLSEKDVNIRTVVLVRCQFKTQYFSESSQPGDEIAFSFGSGVFIDPNGYILTAAHVIRDRSAVAGTSSRIWSFDQCKIARTGDVLNPISSKNPSFLGGEPWFEEVEIVYEPSEEQYKNSGGLDFAILRLKERPGSNSYVRLVPDMIAMEQDMYSVVAIGYPGKDIASQRLERFDAAFVDMVSIEGSNCVEGDITTFCGWRYAVARYLPDFRQYLNARTEWGVESMSVRPGFSGGPVFYKGNLIGIATHGHGSHDGIGPASQWDSFWVLNSRDIVETLKAEGLPL